MLFRLQYKYLVAVVFIFGLFMDLMDSTVVNVALPQLTKDFHASYAAVEWTVTGYLLSLALFIPGAGFLSDRFGTKRIFMLAMGIFVLGSALCGQAQNLSQLVAFRFLQGVGGGMMTPVSTAILSREFPGEERAKASAIISIPVVFAPIVGPVLGGYLIQYLSWRWIFYINLPIGITGIILGAKVLREHREAYAQGRFDIGGLILGGGSAAMLLYALSEAANHAWTSPSVAGWGVAGLAGITLFVLYELRQSPPLLDLRLFKRALFTLGNATVIASFAAFAGFMFLLALYLQVLHGWSPLEAGMIQAPSALGTVFMLVAGRTYSRIGPRRMMLAGFGLGALTLLPFLFVDDKTPVWVLVTLLTLRGMPFGFAFVAAQTIIYGPLPSEKQGLASSIYNTTRQVAASFGVALAATVLVSRTASHLRDASGAQPAQQASAALKAHASVLAFHDAFLIPVLLMLVSCTVALFISDYKARAAMQRALPVRANAFSTGARSPIAPPAATASGVEHSPSTNARPAGAERPLPEPYAGMREDGDG